MLMSFRSFTFWLIKFRFKKVVILKFQGSANNTTLHRTSGVHTDVGAFQ
jgi:hypothetical protein